ncbi:site-specific integrase [Candidatus Binatia bacterium]|nr:site-specific integrase [Candidatus Binatia bacterium]
MSKLTERVCEQAKPDPAGRDLYLRDGGPEGVVGLALRVWPSGHKGFEVRLRINGRPRRLAVGPFHPGSGTLARARKAAVGLKGAVVNGRDPAAERAERRRTEETQRHAPTFSQLTDSWLRSARTGRGRGGRLEGQVRKTWGADEALLKRHFSDWKELPLSVITTADVATRVNEIARRAPVAANRAASLLSTIFRAGVRWGLLASNPAAEAPRAKERPRDQYLDDAQAARLLVAIDQEPDTRWRTFFTLSVLLGTRRGELLALRWDRVLDLDGEHPSILLDGSTTKTGIGRALPLPDTAAALLRQLAADPSHGRLASPLLFSSGRGSATEALVGVRKAWLRVCERAGIDGKEHHLHDLRRGLATALNAAGRPAAVAQHLLGHSTSSMTTKVYTATPDAARRDALNERSSALARAVKRHREKVHKLATGKP